MNILDLDMPNIKTSQTDDSGLETLLCAFRQFCQENEIRSQNLVIEAWEAFKKVVENFSLHGDLLTWLVVSLFVTWKSKLDYQTNFHLNLIKLLNTSRIRMSEFLVKSKRWIRMSVYEPGLISVIDRMISEHTNSSTLFFRYTENYFLIFNFSEELQPVDTSYNKRKQRKKQVSENELFHFTWIMFICAKSFLTEFNGDSINLLHLLTCCLQFVFNSVIMATNLRVKLLNKNYTALSSSTEDLDHKGENIPNLSQSLYSHESTNFQLAFSDIQKSSFMRFLTEMIKRDIIRWDPENPDKFLEPDNFSYNINRLDRYYLEQTINYDLLDERQFLCCLSENDFNTFNSVQLKFVINSCKHNQPDILSSFSSPIKSSYGLYKIEVLKSLGKVFMNFSKFCPEIQKFSKSPELIDLISQITNEVLGKIKSHELADVMVNNYEIVRGIYYKLLISIVNNEEFRTKALHSLERVLFDISFHHLILAIAFEICAYVFNGTNVAFPWILRILEIDSFEFFKIIELVIKSEPMFTRDLVRYFNKIEESIVSYNAWCSNSLLFKYIEKNGSIPTLNDVNFPYSVSLKISHPHAAISESIPTDKLIIQSVTSGIVPICKPPTMCASNLFTNSLHSKKIETVTRNLFQIPNDDKPQTDGMKNLESKDVHHYRISKGPDYYLTPKVGTNFKTSASNLNVSDNNGSSTHSSSSGQNDSSNQSKVLSALVFFMRKLYHLCSSRLLSLCNFLKMDTDHKARCWTCLEYIIVKCHYLLEDHYLDQLIMCCVYAVGRSTSHNWSFNDIMKWYRLQDYCVQNAYRRVLLAPLFDNEGLMTDSSDKKEYGDLITYYNKIFLIPINKYLYMLLNKKDQLTVTLSPLPYLKSIDNFKSHKLTNQCSVYVSPKKSEITNINEYVQVYKFHESPFSDKMMLACEEFQDVLSPKKRRFNSFNTSISPELMCDSPQKSIKSD